MWAMINIILKLMIPWAEAVASSTSANIFRPMSSVCAAPNTHDLNQLEESRGPDQVAESHGWAWVVCCGSVREVRPIATRSERVLTDRATLPRSPARSARRAGDAHANRPSGNRPLTARFSRESLRRRDLTLGQALRAPTRRRGMRIENHRSGDRISVLQSL